MMYLTDGLENTSVSELEQYAMPSIYSTDIGVSLLNIDRDCFIWCNNVK